jgi:cytochrome c oxidase subunit 3
MVSMVRVNTPNTDGGGSSGDRQDGSGASGGGGKRGSMHENVLPFPRRVGPRRQQVGPNAVIGMLVFVVTELMLFAGFMSAFTITRAAYNTWPPIGQPRLPASATLFNSVALLISGGLLVVANRVYVRNPDSARRWLLGSLLLGMFFVVFQGAEWVQLLHQGLTLTSSNHGGFFYLIVGLHGLHAVAAIVALARMYFLLVRGKLERSTFLATSIFWYFVVGVWPMVYFRVYL